jgi:hypothetical protein
MNTVEKKYREFQYASLETNYLATLSNQKDHFMLVYMLLYQLYAPERDFPPYYAKVLEKAPFPTETSACPPRDQIFEKINDQVPQQLVDVLTFSLIPTYCSFFMTMRGVSDFSHLLDQLSPHLQEIYVRAAFVSPFFLTFVADVFRPIISPLLPQGNPPPRDELCAQIRRRWSQNLRSLPPVIGSIFTRPNAQRLLSNGFFAHALRPETAKIFGLCEYYQTPSPALMEELRMLLTGDSREQILRNLIDLSTWEPGESPGLLDEEDVKAVPSLFQPVLLSTLDRRCLETLVNRRPFVPLGPSDWAVSAVSAHERIESEHIQIELTMANQTRAEAYLRHLLQMADRLPKFKSVPPDIDLREFFQDFLVRRGPMSTFKKRHEAVKFLETIIGFSSETAILEPLSQTTLERKKEIRALSAFTSITERYMKLDAACRSLRLDIENVFVSGDIFISCHQHMQSQKTVEFYSKDPDALVADYIKLSGPIREQWRRFESALEIAFTYVTFRFNFSRFRASRPELARYDQQLAEFLVAHGSDVLKVLTDGAYDNKPEKSNVLLQRINGLREKVYVLDILRAAALESNLFRKMREFGKGVLAAQKVVADKFPPAQPAGPDELVPAQVAAIIFAMPHFIVSNYVYIVEFCGSESEEFQAVVGHVVLTAAGALRATIQHLPSVPIATLVQRTT